MNERGQAAIAALVILPVALAIVMTLFILGGALAIEARAVAACRESMWQSQKTAAEALENLQQLNPLAQKLERMRRAADLSLKFAQATLNPKAIALAQAARMAVRALQAPVQAKQKYWYLRGKMASQLAPAKALQAMQRSLPSGVTGFLAKSAGASLVTAASAASRPDLHSARFHLIQTPPGARTPVYRPAPFFTRTQNARAQWLLSLPVQRVDDGATIPKLRIGCEMTLTSGSSRVDSPSGIKGEKTKWEPVITEDKLLRN